MLFRTALLSLTLSGCLSAPPTPDMGVPTDPKAELKPQMPIKVDGKLYPAGSATILRSSSAVLEPSIPKNTVLIIVSTCARQDEFMNPDTSKPFTYNYIPGMFVENIGGCPVSIIAVTSNGEWHRSIVDFTNAPKEPLITDVNCNGRWETYKEGAFFCVVPEGKPVTVVSSELAVIAKDPTANQCEEPAPVPATSREWEIKAGKGPCVYVMLNDSKEFRLTTFGYSSFLKVFPPKDK